MQDDERVHGSLPPVVTAPQTGNGTRVRGACPRGPWLAPLRFELGMKAIAYTTTTTASTARYDSAKRRARVVWPSSPDRPSNASSQAAYERSSVTTGSGSASGAHSAAGALERASVRRMRVNANTPSTAGMPSWNAR